MYDCVRLQRRRIHEINQSRVAYFKMTTLRKRLRFKLDRYAFIYVWVVKNWGRLAFCGGRRWRRSRFRDTRPPVKKNFVRLFAFGVFVAVHGWVEPEID